MQIFQATLGQMMMLISLIVIGFFLAKRNLVSDKTEVVLSKLESMLFIPALSMGTFITKFNRQMLSSAGELMLWSLAIGAVFIFASVFTSKLCAKEAYTQKIYLYGLCFANYGYMGNAVVSAIFPDLFSQYMIYTLTMTVIVYAWAVPALLMGDEGSKPSLGQRLKKMINPICIGMFIGMLIGILEIPVPNFAINVVNTLGSCMSPIAMLLTGMTVARKNMKVILRDKSLYVVTALRLVIYPAAFLILVWLLPIPRTVAICGICFLAMPLGLNSVVIPGAYGKDTSNATGMALVSHVLSCITIPVIFGILLFILDR